MMLTCLVDNYVIPRKRSDPGTYSTGSGNAPLRPANH